MKAPYGLSGYRVKVYRIGSTTQWFTAVITGHNLMTRDLIVMDDTVLESKTENPAHVHMMFLDDVVNSLLKGENVGITSRRRATAAGAVTANSTSQASSLSTYSRSMNSSHQPTPSSMICYPVPQGTKKRKTTKGEGTIDTEGKERDKVVKPEKPSRGERPSTNKNKKERKRKPEENVSDEGKNQPEIPKKTKPSAAEVNSCANVQDPQDLTRGPQSPIKDPLVPSQDHSPPSAADRLQGPNRLLPEKEIVPKTDRSADSMLPKSVPVGAVPGIPTTSVSSTAGQTVVPKSTLNTSALDMTTGPKLTIPMSRKLPVCIGPDSTVELPTESHKTGLNITDSKEGQENISQSDIRANDQHPVIKGRANSGVSDGQPPATKAMANSDISDEKLPATKTPVMAPTDINRMGSLGNSDAGFLLKLSQAISANPNRRQPKTERDSPFTNAIAGIIARELSRDHDRPFKKVGIDGVPPPVEQTSTVSSALPASSTVSTSVSMSNKLFSPMQSVLKAQVSAQEAVIPAVPSEAMVKNCLMKTVTMNSKSAVAAPKSTTKTLASNTMPHPNNRTHSAKSETDRVGAATKGTPRPMPLKDVPRANERSRGAEVDIRKEHVILGRTDYKPKKESREVHGMHQAGGRYDGAPGFKDGSHKGSAGSGSKEPAVKVFRDPNLKDNPVTHVRSIQHTFPHHHLGKQDHHKQSTHLRTAAAQSGALSGSPSAFIPSNLHSNALQTLLPPHLQLYPHHLGLSYNLLHATEGGYHPHMTELMAQQEALTRLRHQQAALLQAAPTLTPAQLQTLLQNQHHTIAIPPTMLVPPTQEELEMAHLRTQRDQQKLHAEKLAQLETKAILHADKHLFSSSPHPLQPSRPQPTSSSGSAHSAEIYRSSGELHNNNHREPMVDVHAAIERHFQESLGKPHLAFTISPYNLTSGSITRGTPLPKTDHRISSSDKEHQHKEQTEQERLRREREEKELEWQRLQREKEYKQNQIQKEMERKIMFPGPGIPSDRERVQKLATSMDLKNDDKLFKHVLNQLKPKYSPDPKADKRTVGDAINLQTSSGPGFQVYQPYKAVTNKPSGLKYEEARPGIPVRTEHNRLKASPSYMSAFQVKPHHLEGYAPFGHTVISGKNHEERTEGIPRSHRGPAHSPHGRTHSPHGSSHSPHGLSHSPRILSHSPHSASHSPHGVASEKERKGIPNPPPLIKKEPGLQDQRVSHEFKESRNIQEVGAKSIWEKQIRHAGRADGTRSVPVIVRHNEVGKPLSHSQASSPLKVASPQQLSRAALQPMEVKSNKHSSQHSPPAKNCSALPPTKSILMSALRPADQQHRSMEDLQERSDVAIKRKSPSQPANVKRMAKDGAVMGVAEKDFRKAGAVTSFSVHCQSLQPNKEQGPFISGSGTIHAKVSENVELKIEKVDQLKRVTADSANPGINRVSAVTSAVSKNGSLSDNERSRSVSPRSLSDSSDSRKTSSPNRTHVKCKKAWIQRLSESTDSPPPQESRQEIPSNPLANGHLHSMNTAGATSEKHPAVTLSDIQKSIPGKVYDFDNMSTGSESSLNCGKPRQKRMRENKRTRKRTASPLASNPQQNGMDHNSQVDAMGDHHKQVTASLIELMAKAPKKRIITRAHKDKEAFSVVRTLSKAALAKLKKSGEPFLQDGPCTNITPTLMKCRECRMKGNKQTKLNIFCRFYAFRRLRYSLKGNLTIAGFSEMDHYDREDLSPWLPSRLGEDPANDVELSKYIMQMTADKFCELVLKEQEAKKALPLSESKITWKRPVGGVREMCDTCDTTLFNIHWTCSKCGFVVCPDCLKAKKGDSTRYHKSPEMWLKCIKDQPHLPENLMLTQIIPGTALWDIGTLVHEIRRRWNLPLACPCSEKPTTEPEVNHGQCKDSQARAIVSTTGDLSTSSSTSALDFLADVATSQSNDVRRDFQNGDTRVDSSTGVETPTSAAETTTNIVTGSKPGGEPCSTLRELLTKTASRMGVPGGPLDGSSFLSALIPKNNEVSPKQGGKHRTMTSTFEDIIATVVEQHIAEPRSRKQDLSCIRKAPWEEQKKPEIGSKNTLTESSLLYPNVPHSWLCDGKLLLLHEPANKGNFKIFQEQWAKGAPVMVSNVHKQLKTSLWHPKYFSKQFGHIENDLVDCRRGTVIQGAPMKDFWDGFQDLTNRLETKQGLPMILKLKDWPPAEDFAEILPEHFADMMANLPLPEYTRRDGILNLSSRLPDFFVKPDLGPKMYNAYGLARYPSAGTTNLHLDISDAVNCMVHVGIPHGGLDDGDQAEALKREAIEAVEYHCKDEQTLRRLKEGSETPGALWHIFKQEDTHKIRAFLNVWSQEQGEELLPDHDPIHDQSWYLDDEMLVRLKEEYDVEGWTIVQFMGDAIFIPAGAPHQVQNLHSCIKVAEDFVSPEHIKECICLTDEFRHLSNTHSNHEDKLQVKNILYHAIKEAAGVLMTNDPLLQAAE